MSSGVTTKTKKGLLKYYTCTRKSKKSYSVSTGTHNEICRGYNWRVDFVNGIIWEKLKNTIRNPEQLIKQLIAQSSDQTHLSELEQAKISLTSEYKNKEAAKDRYIDLYASGVIKTKQDLNNKLNPLTIELEDLDNEISVINEKLKAPQFLDDQIDLSISMLKKYERKIEEDLSIHEKREILSVFIERVILHEGKKIETVYRIISDSGLEGEYSMYNKHENIIACQSYGRS
ncbi:hypothetical protein J2Z69_000726 [Paenibacillus shirakamiensis]|uniref:Recombinase zinc beta ribbon domain-containing protein n=1 Tax=Paenibacillus shirakamiensis TaxID=1265935 RepID=A0ABS4JDA7_9BACL|nr:hypothetical protein [Paenibacillus shirakamiensis]MBP1999707.1 hypothetical protein [Paenibacillus shirakamiensis]